jgi:5-methylcytosine-specific restriction protein B
LNIRKNIIYKYKVYKQFREKIKFQEDKEQKHTEVWKLENYNKMCNQVLNVLNNNPDLIHMSHDRLNGNCYEDTENHLLAMDIVYFGSMCELEDGVNKVDDNAGLTIEEETSKMEIGKNTILYGPPGTGKTYNSVIYAVAIIEEKELEDIGQEDYSSVKNRYDIYKAEGLIEFTTFHQSFGYEDFVEGIRPIMREDCDGVGDIQYEIKSGVFKQFCDKAVHPDNGTNKATGTVIGFDEAWDALVADMRRNEGKRTIHRRTGYELKVNLVDDNRLRVNWKGDKGTHNDLLKEKTREQYENYTYDNRTQYPSNGNKWLFEALQALIDTLVNDFGLGRDIEAPVKNHVFIIDEINRGNISKIFGELITLVEPSRRIGQKEELRAKLPYSGQNFGVPNNVYLLGTMNTADRSIANIDTALRRRFDFIEMMPDASVLDGVYVEDISIRDMLMQMNRRIAVLYDREHTIGHAYFMSLRENPTIDELASIFKNRIIPLLQEYFYEDYEKIRLVLGDNNKENQEEQFIIRLENDYVELFGNNDYGFDDTCSYEINENAFDNIGAYRDI